MSALATTPELKVALQALKDVHQAVLAQPRVRPSPTPEFSGTPSPTPTSTPFKKKGKEKHKKRSAQVASGFPEVGCAVWAADLQRATRERASARFPTLLSAAEC